DATGRFRIVPARSGVHEFVVSVPGLALYRFAVTVPPSRSLRLPVIRLAGGASFRMRLVSAGGEPILAPQFHRRHFDTNGGPIADPLGDQPSAPGENDGAITIGPLPPGIMTLAIDMPFFARTRVPDVHVADATKNIDGGTIVIQQPGAVLNVNVLDGAGAAVANHDVSLEDPRPRSPLVFPRERTNLKGRVTFDRLAAGRYRISTTAVDRCDGVLLTTSRVVPVAVNGTVDTPLVIGGRATFRVTSPLGPAIAVQVSASPDVPTPPSPFPFRPPDSGCRGVTDEEGRVTLTNFPPGPARVDVRMTNSTYRRQVEVPLDGREVAFAIPDGLLPVHVVNDKNEPVRGATITWTSGGARVEATAMATGDALLEGVGTAGGTLAVSAPRYQPAEEPLAEPPATLHTLALTPLPPPAHLRARVMTPAGEPLRDAVVEFLSTDPAAVPRVVPTDRRGAVMFDDLPPGSIQLIASADGFVTSIIRIATDATGDVQVVLSRGYRAIASVELPATAGPQLVRVLNDSNRSMDDVLDGESDRRIEPPGRVSLGPLAPGAYVIELQGPAGRRQERIRIVDRDVDATFR
ncbi:MAG TPA: carboxypeptidase regulatory-like domain-containing protein, partial [Vicinamibacterales bacterium]|nr:carboxypeptidase regulatory-like domain-containing protein [Vicinamibacterales bacterium]